MATLVLGAVGGAVGGAFGGSVLGVGGAALGHAAGAVVGRAVDQRLLGGASEPVSQGRVDRFRLNGASEGAVLPRVYGRMRVGAQVIWASPFEERTSRRAGRGGRKGRASRPAVVEHGYTVSLALALCEGPVLRVGRVWADGRALPDGAVNMRVHHGGHDQLPDALIEAVEGEGRAPAYRGTAYVVVEDVDLGAFGNRVPQFSFEVVREVDVGGTPAPQRLVQGVSIIPGTGEFALATDRVDHVLGIGARRAANVHTPAEIPDFSVSLRQLREEVPGLRSASLVVSWFGDDLRCGRCRLRPMVEEANARTEPSDWTVAGLARSEARVVPRVDGRAVYGGTPDDGSVVQAIRALKAGGQDVTLHPFILMTQLPGNGLPGLLDGGEQPSLPWRGRIGSGADGTDGATMEVAAFFGAARASDFTVTDGGVRYTGPDDWGFCRFVLHNAALAAAAGGVEGFVLGSELRSLTTLRDGAGDYPAIAQMRALAGEVRTLLPDAKIGYAADWTEWNGHRPSDRGGDVRFHLDPLWADPVIDFVGIDIYAPLSDWRDGDDHRDAAWGAAHNLDYLRANVEGGEAYDWFYADGAARAAQVRTPITDDGHREAWVNRAKDIRSWWSNTHHERVDGARATEPTDWRPGMKPVRFIEYGCAAVDKGANEPSRFPDARSSEGGLPRFSSGVRDDAIQMQFIRALLGYWTDHAPISDVYGGPMIDLAHSFLWAWDARPWPAFPNDRAVWMDGVNHATGHWWTGRSALLPLADVIRGICRDAGLERVNVSAVRGVVRGITADAVQSARADLEPLLAAHGVEAVEHGGAVLFRMRADAKALEVDPASFVRTDDDAVVRETHGPAVEAVGCARVRHYDADGRFEGLVGEAVDPIRPNTASIESELPMTLTPSEGIALAERFVAESTLGRDEVAFTVPPSSQMAPGDLIVLVDRTGTWRVDRVEGIDVRSVEATRTDPSALVQARTIAGDPVMPSYRAATAPLLEVLDLPGPAPAGTVHAVTAAPPWSGPIVILSGAAGSHSGPAALLPSSGIVGATETVLSAAPPGILDWGSPLHVRIVGGALTTVSEGALLSGANLCAIGDGTDWELVQFRDSVAIAEGVWALSGRLRGRRGTDGVMRNAWPVGSRFVMLDETAVELRGDVGVAMTIRYGPEGFAPDHATWRQRSTVPRGVAERPYAPAHLRQTRLAGTDRFSWIRRSRTAVGDWDRPVSMGERTERYAVRVTCGKDTVWRADVSVPAVTVDRAILPPTGGCRFAVAQISDSWGIGPWTEIAIS